MFDDTIDAVSLDDRTITESHNEVLDTHPDRNGLAEVEVCDFERSSRTSYGVSGDLVTVRQKKIFDLLRPMTRLCLTPAPPEHFIAVFGQ